MENNIIYFRCMCSHCIINGCGYVCELFDNKVLERGNKPTPKRIGIYPYGFGEKKF